MENKRTAFFYDFDDSFSYNVIAMLRELNYNVVVHHYLNFETNQHADLMVLGPGPGHPDDYATFVSILHENIEKFPSQKWLGICLGHQILGMYLGFKLAQNSGPIHGQALPFVIPSWKVFNHTYWNNSVQVQFYNSWSLQKDSRISLKTVDYDGRLLAFHNNRFLGLQFHPESVGSALGAKLFVSGFDSVYTEQDGFSVSP